MDAEKKRVLLVWLNCLELGPELKNIPQLSDGSHISEILKIIWISNSNRQNINASNWINSLQCFLEDYFRHGLSSVVAFDEIGDGSEWELSKAVLLLLCATIHFTGDERFVNRLVVLEQPDQLMIKALVEGVLFDDLSTLNNNFANVLIKADVSFSSEMRDSRPGSPMIYENTSDSSRSIDEIQLSLSPIRQLMQSPQMLMKLTIREKDRKIHNLESELDTERSLRIDAETLLETTKIQLDGREISVKRLQRELNDLQSRFSDIDSQLHKAEDELQKATSKLLTVDDLNQELRLMTLDRQSLVTEKRNLEIKVDRLELAYKGCERRTRDTAEVRSELCFLQDELAEKDAIIVGLRSDIMDIDMALSKERELNAEKFKSLQEKLIVKPEPQGEPMSVITEEYLHELKVKHAQLQDEFTLYMQSSKNKCDELVEQIKAIDEVHQRTNVELKIERDRRLDLDRLLEEMRINGKQEVDDLLNRVNELCGLSEATKREKEKVVDELDKELDCLKRHVEEKTRDLDAVSQELCEKRVENESLAKRVVSNDIFIDKLHQQLEAAKSRTALIEKQYLECNELYRKSHDEKLQLDLNFEALRHQLAEGELHLVESANIVKQRDMEILNLRSDLSLLNSQFQEALTSIRNLEVKFMEKDKLVNQLENEILNKEDYAKTILTTQEDLKKKLCKQDQEIINLNEALNGKIDEISALQHVSVVKEDEFDKIKLNLIKEINSVQKNVEQREAELNKLRPEFDSLNFKFQEMMTAKINLDELIAKLEDHLMEKNGLVNRLEGELRDTHDIINNKQGEEEKLIKNFNKLERDIFQLDEDLKIKTEELSQLRDLFSLKEDELHDVQSQLANKISFADNIIKEHAIKMNNLQEDVSILKIQLQEEASLKSNVEDDKTKLEAVLEENNKLVECLKDQTRYKDNIIDEKLNEEKSLVEKLEKLSTEKIELENHVEMIQSANNCLENDLIVNAKELARLQNEVALDKDRQIVINELTSKYEEAMLSLRELERRTADLEGEIAVKDQLSKQLEEKVHSQDVVIREKLADEECMMEKIEKLLSEKTCLDGHVATLKNDIELKQHELNNVGQKFKVETSFLRQVAEERRLEVERLQGVVSHLEIQIHDLQSMKINLETELKEKSDELVQLKEELRSLSDKMVREIESLKREAYQQREIMLSPPATTSPQSSSTKGYLRVTSFADIERARRRSADTCVGNTSLFNHSSMKVEPRDESLRRSSWTINSSYCDVKRFEIDVPHEEVDDDIDRLEDSLEEVELPYDGRESVNGGNDVIARLTNKVNILSGELENLREKQAQLEMQKKETNDLLLDNRTLEAEVKHLRERLEEQVAAAKFRSDLPNVIQELKHRVFESEQKNLAGLKTVKDEYDQLNAQYDALIRVANEAKRNQFEREEVFNQQLEECRLYAESKKQQFNEAISLLKKEKEAVYILQSQLQEEEKKLAPYIDKIREQEMTINRHVAEKRSLEAQLDLASQKLRESLKSAAEVTRQSHSQSTLHCQPKISRQSAASLSSMRLSLNEVGSSRQSVFENLISLRSASTHDLDDKLWSTSDASMISNNRAVPSGVGNYFTCEDEEGEFHNFSYLHDLKRGSCDPPDNHLGRISELQRRNTLCRPHLKTSYPVETQMHLEQQFTDDNLKEGMAVDDRLMDIINESSDLNMTANRRVKPIQSSYHKPGPPTPGKTAKQGSQITSENKKVIKTPSSIQKLFKRTCKFGTPKQQYRVTTPKKNNVENVPPQFNETASRVRKNIAYQLGFSPKSSPKFKDHIESKALKLAVFNDPFGLKQPPFVV